MDICSGNKHVAQAANKEFGCQISNHVLTHKHMHGLCLCRPLYIYTHRHIHTSDKHEA